MPPDPSPSTLRTRPSLLFRLRDWKDEASWTEFYQLYYHLIYGCSRRAGLAHADAEEVAQDVFKRVAETIAEFESNPARGTFRSWLLQLTRWKIADKFRARKPHEKQPAAGYGCDDADRTSTIERLPNEETFSAHWNAEWQQNLLDTAANRLARRVPAKHFQAFDLYKRQGWSVLRVAQSLDLSCASVYVISHRLTKQLKVEIKTLGMRLA